MAVQNAAQNELFQRVNFVSFTSSGTYTPPDNLVYAMIEATAGGGGRRRLSGATLSDQANIANFPTAGQSGLVLVQASTLPATVEITIGAGASSTSIGAGGTGGDTEVGLSTPIVVSGANGSTDVVLTSSGTNPPVAQLPNPSMQTANDGWDLLIRGQCGPSVIAFNRWPGMVDNFKVVICWPNTVTTRPGLGNLFSVNIVDGDGRDLIEPPVGSFLSSSAPLATFFGGAVYPGMRTYGSASSSISTGGNISARGGAVFITEFLRG